MNRGTVDSLTEAVRCLYLARVTGRLGHPAAAQRWQEKADRCLEAIAPGQKESIRHAPALQWLFQSY
jgi:hypothetical protein